VLDKRTYAKSDRVGIMLGWASAALALVSGVAGLLVRRMR
jgi:hypothetical protein